MSACEFNSTNNGTVSQAHSQQIQRGSNRTSRKTSIVWDRLGMYNPESSNMEISWSFRDIVSNNLWAKETATGCGSRNATEPIRKLCQIWLFNFGTWFLKWQLIIFMWSSSSPRVQKFITFEYRPGCRAQCPREVVQRFLCSFFFLNFNLVLLRLDCIPPDPISDVCSLTGK